MLNKYKWWVLVGSDFEAADKANNRKINIRKRSFYDFLQGRLVSHTRQCNIVINFDALSSSRSPRPISR